MSEADLPLAGLRVLEFAHLIAGPSAAMALFEMGAEVIKLESDRGDRSRALSKQGIFRSYNRGKRSVVLDLKSDSGRIAAEALIRHVDVIIQASVPGVMTRLGLDYETAVRINPRIIYVSVSAFNVAGPDRDRGGLDAVIQAECGLMSITGYEDLPPVKVGAQIADTATGLAIGQAVCAALFRRERTGRGSHITTSLFDVAVYIQAGQFADYFLSNEENGRLGNSTAFGYPTDVFLARDGYIQVTAYFDDRWRKLCDILGLPDLPTDSRFASNRNRLANRNELRSLLATAVSRFSRQELRDAMHAAGIPMGDVRSYGEIDARLSGTDADPFRQSDGAIASRVVAQPFAGDLGIRHISARPPELGEHTAEVLRELGLSALA